MRPTAAIPYVPARPPGFALVATVLVLAAIALLSVGLFTVMRYEVAVVGAHERSFRAELAAESGLAAAANKLAMATEDDLSVVFTKESENGTPVLVAVRPSSDRTRWEVVPLVSGGWTPEGPTSLADLPKPPVPGAKEATEVPVMPWQGLEGKRGVQTVGWQAMPEAAAGGHTLRYAYWIEDLQGYVDGGTAGNQDGKGKLHARSGPGDASAPGLAADPATRTKALPSRLRDVALYALDPDAAEDDRSSTGLDDRVLENRENAVTEGTLLALLGGDGRRATETGHSVDPKLAALEAGLAIGRLPYEEAALVPFVTGKDGTPVLRKPGTAMLDLNQWLERGESDAIPAFADAIRKNLPEFEGGRKGGFPEDYLQTLAAGARDYADKDTEPTVSATYRGLDGQPAITEQYLRFKWDKIDRRDGRVFAVFSITPFVELWNPTNIPVSGTFQLSFEANMLFNVGVASYSFTGPPAAASDPEICAPTPEESDGLFWCPPVDVGDSTWILPQGGPAGPIQPNEYRFYQLETYQFAFDAGPSSVYLPSKLSFPEDLTSSYHFRWNGKLVDAPLGRLKRLTMTLNYPGNSASSCYQQHRGTFPGHSYRPAGYLNNMGDPRIARYIAAPQDPNAWPGNGNPGRRTIRWNIFEDGTNEVYSRVKPSEWPDGGHDSSFGAPVVIPDDRRLSPDDARFYNGAPAVEPDKAPQRISNRGRFTSATELGHVYDPVMWNQGLDIDTRTTSVLHQIDTNATASPSHGGGNTLRIGRPEHPMFDSAGLRASRLLDVFFAGATDRGVTSGFRLVDGHINLNTAGPDALRALAVGPLLQDPVIGKVVAEETPSLDKQTTPQTIGTPTTKRPADKLVDAIIRHRQTYGPFQSPSELAEVKLADGTPAFGNLKAYKLERSKLVAGKWTPGVDWSDAAAEELFARMFNGATVRSRNFRVFVVGEVVGANGQVVARRARMAHLFLDPGTHRPTEPLAKGYPRPIVTYSRDL